MIARRMFVWRMAAMLPFAGLFAILSSRLILESGRKMSVLR